MSINIHALPWPVRQSSSCLLATHWPPDSDGLSCIAGWYASAMTTSPESTVKFYCPAELPSRHEWLLDGIARESSYQLDRYETCLVFDCSGMSHRTKLPRAFVDAMNSKEALFSVDHHYEDAESAADCDRFHVELLPSTGCILMGHGIFHPVLFSGLWSDTQGLRVHAKESITFMSRMFDLGITQEEVNRQISLLEPRKPEMLLRDLCERTCIHATWLSRQAGIVIVVTPSKTHAWRHPDSMNEVREIVKYYADVVAIVDQHEDRVSLWSRPEALLDLGSFAKSYLSGGGHAHMAGGQLHPLSVSELTDALQEFLGCQGTSE